MRDACQVHDMPQRSPEWYQVRAGRLTASVAHEMLATLKRGGEAAGRRNLRLRLVLERLTGKPLENGYVSAAMQQGIEREAEAIAAYEAETGSLVEPVGFVSHRDLMVGGSPDGHVLGPRDDGLVECKCPEPAAHLAVLRSDTVPGDYLKQITALLWLTGCAWCDFVSYQPDFPEPLRLKVIRAWAKDLDLEGYELAAKLFLTEVDRELAQVKALMEAAA